MNNTFIYLLIFSYVIGSVSVGDIIARKKGIDISRVGSGNRGATNFWRVMGWKIGLLSLFCDVLKGIAPVWLAYSLGFSDWFLVGIGSVVVAGHLYPLSWSWLKRIFNKSLPRAKRIKGGKGVATAAGVFIVLNIQAIGIAVLIFLLVAGISRYVSAASIMAAITVFTVQIARTEPWNSVNLPITILSLIILIAVVFKHRSNISRILAGTENKISFSKGKG